MAQHDYDIANASGAVVRADINDVLEAIASLNSGPTAPPVTFPNMWFKNDGDNVLYIRNSTNTLWIPVASKIGSVWTLYKTESKGADVASGATTDIWQDETADTVMVTGGAAIVSFGTAPRAGSEKRVILQGDLTITNGPNLVCPGNANIAADPGDTFVVLAETTTRMKIISYTRSNGRALVPTTDPNLVLDNWVIFNGSDGSIIEQMNVSSVTRISAGLYTVNFSTPKANTNYAAVGTGSRASGNQDSSFVYDRNNPRTVNGVTFFNQAAGSAIDVDVASVFVIGPKV